MYLVKNQFWTEKSILKLFRPPRTGMQLNHGNVKIHTQSIPEIVTDDDDDDNDDMHVCLWVIWMRPQGHSSYITHLDWSPDNNFIMSNSGDYEILYCECWCISAAVLSVCTARCSANTRVFSGDVPNGCKLIRNRSECKDIDWATYTCVLGYHVFGQYIRTHSQVTSDRW